MFSVYMYMCIYIYMYIYILYVYIYIPVMYKNPCALNEVLTHEIRQERYQGVPGGKGPAQHAEGQDEDQGR